MGSQNIHLLLIEDNPGDAGLIREMLAEAKGMSFEVEWTETLSEGIERLASGGIDVVLLDLALTDSTGLETLRRLRAASPWAPVVVVLSGLSDEEVSFQAVQEGAQDYLIKGQVDSSLLIRSIRYALERGHEQEALRRAQVELENRVHERTADLVKANEALRNSQHLLQGILNNSTAMISVKDLQGRYMLVNHGYERLFHANSESLVGKTVYDLLPREYADRVRASDQRVLNSGNVLEMEESIPHDDGLHTYIANRSPLRDGEGRPYAVCVIATDITEWKRFQEEARAERKQAEEALRQAQADLTRASRLSSMGELTASLAHEVNQPIASVLLNADACLRWLSRDQPDLGKARAAASRIAQDGKRAGEIVNRVSLLFKKGTLQRELVDPNEIVREMTLLLHSEATQIAVLVRTELAADLPQVMGDRVQLQQVLMNLMMNSIDAMKDMDGRRELTIQSQRGADGQVLISVSDTGVGLPQEQADKIFNAFFTTKTHGTGMGLQISRSIVESHGGRLWAADNPPRGARFCFTLPADNATYDPVVSGDHTEAADGSHANYPVI
jgi:PAS domain S-box-containing protein